MTDARTTGARGAAGGFTLLELMAAIGILVFGVTTLIGVLGFGIGQRRGAEMRSRAVLLADRVLHEIEIGTLADAPLPDEIEESSQLAIERLEAREIEGFPGMQYTAEFTVDPATPELVLVRIKVSWLDQGESQAQEFLRVLAREVPFSERVARRRRQT